MIDEERWLMKKVDWWSKLIDEESWLLKKVDSWRKLNDEESELMMTWWLVITQMMTLVLAIETKISQNGLKVAKEGHKSEGCMGMMADRHDGW